MVDGSKPIDPDFGKETQIRIKIEVRDMLEKAKIIPRESASDCIKRLILENQSLKTEIEVCKEQVRSLEQEKVKQG